jgi:xylose isomerase
MFTITLDKECGCFKRSDLTNNQSFESKDDALIEAKRMEGVMNDTFCQKHTFSLREEGDTFALSLANRPRQSSGGCCGGGHCS